MLKMLLVVVVDAVILVCMVRWFSYVVTSNYTKHVWIQKVFPCYEHRGFTPTQNKHTLATMAVCCMLLYLAGTFI